jgi:hypothetical protein
MPAWRDWYHLMANTYGTWLPGDPRGFRTRHHREHVEGDYKNPPPKGVYEHRHEHAQRQMKRDAVLLNGIARPAALKAIVHAMRTVHELEVLAACVSRMHAHVLVRLPPSLRQKPTLSKRGLRASALDDPARHYLGIAKKESAKSMATEGLVSPGGVWARRGKIVRIRNRPHQVNVFYYILDHYHEGAAVWAFSEPDVVRMREPTD